MQSMQSSERSTRKKAQLKHKPTVLNSCCFSLQHNWKHLKECVVTISPDQRCVSFRGGVEENKYVMAVKIKQR